MLREVIATNSFAVADFVSVFLPMIEQNNPFFFGNGFHTMIVEWKRFLTEKAVLLWPFLLHHEASARMKTATWQKIGYMDPIFVHLNLAHLTRPSHNKQDKTHKTLKKNKFSAKKKYLAQEVLNICENYFN